MTPKTTELAEKLLEVGEDRICPNPDCEAHLWRIDSLFYDGIEGQRIGRVWCGYCHQLFKAPPRIHYLEDSSKPNEKGREE